MYIILPATPAVVLLLPHLLAQPERFSPPRDLGAEITGCFPLILGKQNGIVVYDVASAHLHDHLDAPVRSWPHHRGNGSVAPACC